MNIPGNRNPNSSGMNTGGEMLAEGSTRRVMADISRCFSKSKVQSEAAEDERARLARDLHDGVLQTLTAVSLQLEAAAKLIATDPDASRAWLGTIGDMITSEQRELRLFIQRLNVAAGRPMTSAAELATALAKLRDRAESLGGLRVTLAVDGHGSIPRILGEEIFRIVQEALNNVARHARAQSTRARITIEPDKVCIRISDDGCGFPFHGEYDLASLAAKNRGPVSLRGRVAALRGELMLSSSNSGSSLDIFLPNDQSALDWIHSRTTEPGLSATAVRRS
jgi:signal transduction histidine kinase